VPGPVRGLLFGDAGQLLAQTIGALTNLVFVFGTAYVFFRFVGRVIGNRVSSDVEWTGLDSSEMGSEAYPPG
jgi:Amt family ammonium transporter